MQIPEIRPISDLARDARGILERARQRQEPIVITQRGRDAAVLVPIELYRRMESRAKRGIPRVRFRPGDSERFKIEMTVLDEQSDARV